MKTLATFVLVPFIVVYLTGCATDRHGGPPPVSVTLQPQKAYLYGRFHVKSQKPPMGLVLKNTVTGQTVSFPFLAERDVYPIEVDPGTYLVSHLNVSWKDVDSPLFDKYITIWSGKEPVEIPEEAFKIGKPFEVRAGRAYYIGDFLGFTVNKSGLVPHSVGGVKNVELNYDRTTTDLKAAYPQFNNIETSSVWPLKP